MTPQEVEDALRQLVDKANAAGPGNQWEFEELSEWLTGYLSGRDEEVERFPGEEDEAHWDLTSTDHEFGKSATFFVALFFGDEVQLVGGRGDAAQVRAFGENDFPDDATQMIPELRRRFELVSAPLVVARRELDEWLAAQRRSLDT